MKKQIFTIFGFGLIIGALFFGGYFVHAAIQSEVGINIYDPISPRRTFPVFAATAADLTVGDANTLPATLLVTNDLVDNTMERVQIVNTDDQTHSNKIPNTPMISNGSLWDRQKSASATNLTDVDLLGVPLVAQHGTWTEFANAGDNAQSIATRTAGGGTQRHVVTTVSACVTNVTAANSGTIRLTSGVTTFFNIVVASVLDETFCYTQNGLNITGLANGNMILDFSGACGAGCFESVFMTGYSVN